MQLTSIQDIKEFDGTYLTSDNTEPWSSCCEHSGRDPRELDLENIRGVSSTNRWAGGEARADAASDPVHTETGSVANVTALEPKQYIEC